MSGDSFWRPSASLPVLRARARFYDQIRAFFRARDVLEVDVPVIGTGATTDPHIESIVLAAADEASASRYLQTSPEFAMKRLLAAGSGAIYSLGKAFRHEQAGRRHNPEFTLLEWYRPGFDDHQLMDEVAALVRMAVPVARVEKLSYRAAFEGRLGVDPHRVPLPELKALARRHIDIAWDDSDRDTWLNLLITHVIEPDLGEGLTFIHDYPASQAALAKVEPDAQGQPVARRFEAFLDGVELANGYWELTDAGEQRRRFEADLQRRRQLGLAVCPFDRRLLAALEAGMPPTAGVALGVDRLLMRVVGAGSIEEVLAFPADRT